MTDKPKNPHAVALGRRGGKANAGKGARDWWATLTPQERKRRIEAWRANRWVKNRTAETDAKGPAGPPASPHPLAGPSVQRPNT